MNRVLVIATRQIGDVLLTTPLIRAVREQWPLAHIDVLGFAGTLGMLAGNADVAERIETAPRLGWSGLRALAARLWRRYDLALVTDAGDRAHLIGWLASATRAGIVPDEGGSRWWKRLSLRHAVASSGDRGATHVVEEKVALLAPWRAAGATVSRVQPPAGRPLPESLAAQLEPAPILVHVPSMWAYKQWPLAHFRVLVEGLLAEGRQVVLTGSGAARDQECIAAVRDLGAPPRLIDASGQLDFQQLVTLIQRCALYIGPDTSVSHLAAATGIATIAVFGPTNPRRWAPWPASGEHPVRFERMALRQQAGNVTLLQADKHCVPCGRAGCEDHRNSRSDCLQEITPERVLAEARRILEQACAT
jgi:heptosyltransferase-3